MPRTGSRALAILAVLAVVALAIAALARSEPPPVLDPVPAPTVHLDQPSSGRVLREDEVRSQLGPAWADARYELLRAADTGAIVALPGLNQDRLVWYVAKEDEARVYDATSGVRLRTIAGPPSR